MTDLHSLRLQLSSNTENDTSNIAFGYKSFGFNVNNVLNINENAVGDIIQPEYIILHMNNPYNLSYIKSYVSCLNLRFKINGNNILYIPLQLLWNIETPEIVINKLFIPLHFDIFFGDIHTCGLRNNQVEFSIEYLNNSNQVFNIDFSGFSLLCKVCCVTDNRLQYIQDISNNFIQQVSIIQLKNDVGSSEFRIRTNNFTGLVKGFFIEATDIDSLEEVHFYTNQFVRFYFEKYLIRQKFVKINENMYYFPFNSEKSYNDRSQASYNGAINFNTFEYSFLNLKFSTIQEKVSIYGLNKNIYNQRHEVVSIQNMNSSFNLYERIMTNYLPPIEDLIQPFIQRDIELQNNVLDVAHINDPSFNDIPYISQVLNRKIGENDNNTCPIEQIEIQPNERYMLCSNCKNCYNEYAMINWFVNCNSNNRVVTCPTCRETWSDHNVYINADNEIAVI
jgi:hypothetical protein